MTEKTLDGAYGIATPEDSVRLYRDWAATYDQDFAASHGYIVPEQLAAVFCASGGAGPVLDIGAGTGLVGDALALAMPGLAVDAIDISQEMLDVAERKAVYRQHLCADLTKALDLPDGAYQGLVSAGTFTHGHVGAGCLPEILRIAAPGAVFALSINAEAFDKAGFGSAFAGLVADGALEPVAFKRIAMYAAGSAHDHAAATGLVAVTRRL